MPLQGFGVAPAGTHLLQIGRHGLLKRGQGKMTGLVLPGGATQHAGRWFVHRLSLYGGRVSSQDRFFTEVWLPWVWLQVISLDEFWWPGVVVVASLGGAFLGHCPWAGWKGPQGETGEREHENPLAIFNGSGGSN